MNNEGQMNRAELKIQSTLGAYLKMRGALSEPAADGGHIDEDLLTAFVEGNLNEKEAMPVLSHLTACSFCLHVSAELIKLDLAFAIDEAPEGLPKEEPRKVGEVLSNILSRIFGTDNDAVFAHEEKNEETSDSTDDESE